MTTMMNHVKKTRLVVLGFQEAINKIKDTDFVMYRSGVWNSYEKTPTSRVIKCIENSGYGADVFIGEDGMYYISKPCDSDMW